MNNNTDSVMQNKTTPEYKLCERVRRKFREGIREFNLINDGDHILVGCSGGKDSMALLQLLGEMLRYSKLQFRVTAVHVKMSNVDYEGDTNYLSAFAQKYGVEFLTESTTFDTDQNPHRTPCFLCSWNRRKALFEKAQELGCNKVALGHHKDDIVITTLLNLAFNGSFSTMPVLLKMRKMPFSIIRPLCKVTASDLVEWSRIQQYQPLVKVCPHDKESNRTDMGIALSELEKIAPEIKNNIWRALNKENKLVEHPPYVDSLDI